MNRVQSFFLLCVHAKDSNFAAIDVHSIIFKILVEPSDLIRRTEHQDKHCTENISSSFPSSSEFLMFFLQTLPLFPKQSRLSGPDESTVSQM